LEVLKISASFFNENLLVRKNPRNWELKVLEFSFILTQSKVHWLSSPLKIPQKNKLRSWKKSQNVVTERVGTLQ